MIIFDFFTTIRLGAVAKFGLMTKNELQAIEKVQKPQAFNELICNNGPSFWCQSIM